MSGFFVGQRVRIRWSLTWPYLNGQPGRIVAKLSDAQRQYLPTGHSGEWEVAPDAWGGSASPDAVGYFFPASEQLDPLDPEGMHPVEWADCAWQPANFIDGAAALVTSFVDPVESPVGVALPYPSSPNYPGYFVGKIA